MRPQISLLLLSLFFAFPLHAADPNPMVDRMREALKNTMLQLRDAQTKLAEAESKTFTLEAEKKTLEEQVAALTKQAISDKDTNDKTLTDLRAKSDVQTAEIAAQKAAIEKWKVALQKSNDFGQKTEAARAKLAGEKIILDRTVADQRTKNAEMYKIGTEILTRYEKFGLGDALTAREPFVGFTRVKFENLIQDYSDKIADQKIKP